MARRDHVWSLEEIAARCWIKDWDVLVAASSGKVAPSMRLEAANAGGTIFGIMAFIGFCLIATAIADSSGGAFLLGVAFMAIGILGIGLTVANP